ncbi:hypothetical protein [Glycomyces sp. MUSA5-2]|uniref:hypothetical protein n=1 Tax=Glycomyces sp. MUSA5-2 TaxID=2053002 RepID=UPI0030094785
MSNGFQSPGEALDTDIRIRAAAVQAAANIIEQRPDELYAFFNCVEVLEKYIRSGTKPDDERMTKGF